MRATRVGSRNILLERLTLMNDRPFASGLIRQLRIRDGCPEPRAGAPADPAVCRAEVRCDDADPQGLERARGKMDDVLFRRARHVISEIERTLHAAEGVGVSNWPTVGQLMCASHASLRDDYEVSCPELDAVVEIAQEIGVKGGVFGCRMTGGGFGGCTVALVQAEKVAGISKRIETEYLKRTKIKPTLFVSRPAAGATVLRS